MDYDDLMRLIKEFGRYQVFLTFLTTAIWMANCFNHLGITFLADTPDFWCTDAGPFNSSLTFPSNSSNKQDQCIIHYTNSSFNSLIRNETIVRGRNHTYDGSNKECTTWKYDNTQYTSTIVTEWNLVCNRRWMVSIGNSVYMAGLLVGVMLFGMLADKIGRRRTLLITLVGMMSMQFAVAYAPTMTLFIVFRFFVAFFTQGMSSASYVIAMEMTGPSYRLYPWMVHKATWSLFIMVLAGIAYFIRSWRTLQLVLACHSIPLLIYFILIPESARWYFANGHEKKGEKIVRNMAKWNGTSEKLPEKLLITVKGSQTANVWDLVRTPVMRKRSIIVFSYWVVTSMVYFGLALNISKLGGNIYINTLISGACELFKDPLLLPICKFWGRKMPCALSMILAGAFLLATLAVPADQQVVVVVLSLIGRVMIGASFNMAYLYSAEVFPTLLRSAAVGTSSMFARVGGILAPLIGELDQYHTAIPVCIFGGFSLVGGIAALFLPETKGVKLPETVEEVENPKSKEESNPSIKDEKEKDAIPNNGTRF